MSDEDVDLPVSRTPATIQDRIAAFGMLDAMPNATLAQKSLRLALVGFHRQEIAAMLGISVQGVSQNIYAERNKGKKKPAKKATAAE